MTKHDYLTIADALAIHAVLIKRYGGSTGIRDIGALESALSRPQSGYYKDLIEEAAALFESLIINHPFVDGNKRVAFAGTDIFLRINGSEITGSDKDTYLKIIAMFGGGNLDVKNLEKWMSKVVKPLKN
jgi:death-on-curing protein